jgi:hypothetical protein
MNYSAMHSRLLVFHPVAFVLARREDRCESAERISDVYNTAPTSTSALCLLDMYRPPRCWHKAILDAVRRLPSSEKCELLIHVLYS